ncbi:hypothetical protein AVANS_1541 [Campylobacter sp. RM5004]|uniref:hypothetical protein n=1 Tax=Campylobacter sp. RM5004 TaxID=1660078 RepID=UPI001EFB969E|nr:hypothetical protein [Campylobacter sp. RM5004]ULO02150.1 hypothetical protein AVANS_1541 [Campylobacter sp. RM5004]
MLKIDGFCVDLSSCINTSVSKKADVNSTLNLSQIRKDIKTNNFEYKTSDKELNVFFSLDNKSVGISLDKDILKDLKSFFNKNDFLDENGKTILKGDAANYVAGWFSEIANKFLEVSQNAVLSKEEILNSRLGIRLNGEINEYNLLQITNVELNAKGDYISDEIYEAHNTISKDLSDTILKDKNKDGSLTLDELVLNESKEKYLKDLENLYKYSEKIELDEKPKIDKKLKEYAINEENNRIRKLKQDIKLFKNSNALKINEDKEKELKDKNTLEDFCNFSIKLIDELKDYKLLDLKA